MKFIITEKAKNYLNQRSIDTISFEKKICNRGWAGPMIEAVYSPSSPQVGENYDSYAINGINVYIDKGFKFTEDQAEIDLRGILFLKEIFLSNVKLLQE